MGAGCRLWSRPCACKRLGEEQASTGARKRILQAPTWSPSTCKRQRTPTGPSPQKERGAGWEWIYLPDVQEVFSPSHSAFWLCCTPPPFGAGRGIPSNDDIIQGPPHYIILAELPYLNSSRRELANQGKAWVNPWPAVSTLLGCFGAIQHQNSGQVPSRTRHKSCNWDN